jgi:uncharacterized protein (UPF0276 family)
VPAEIGAGALGLGWRRESASFVLGQSRLGFLEVMAEGLGDEKRLPVALEAVRRRGIPVVPHGVSLSLGSAAPPDAHRLRSLAAIAEALDAPLVSEHVAFVRSGPLDAGQLLPVPRTWDALHVLVENVRIAQRALPVPLALENVAAVLAWPGAQLDEADFLTELLDRTGALLLLDVANLYANGRNHGFDAVDVLDRLPLERVAYAHVAGGSEVDGVYVDSHAAPVPPGVLRLVEELAARCPQAPVMLERDREHPTDAELDAELDAIVAAQQAGCARVG